MIKMLIACDQCRWRQNPAYYLLLEHGLHYVIAYFKIFDTDYSKQFSILY